MKWNRRQKLNFRKFRVRFSGSVSHFVVSSLSILSSFRIAATQEWLAICARKPKVPSLSLATSYVQG